MDFLKYLDKKIEGDPKLKEIYERKDFENLLFDIGNMVHIERIKNKMQQKVLAKKLKTSQSYISRLENGSFSPSLEKLQRVAEIFGGFIDVAIHFDKKNDTVFHSTDGTESCYFQVGLKEKLPFNEKNLKIETKNDKVLLKYY